MVKKLFSTTVLLLSILSFSNLFGHATAIKRKNCWGFLSYKYKTSSQVSKFAGVLNGRHPYYVSVGDDISYGCSGKHSSSHYSYDNNTKVGTAWGRSDSNGTEVFSYTNHWTLLAGTEGPGYPIDLDAFEQMDKEGSSTSQMSEQDHITDDKIFRIENLSGVLKIKKNSNFFSTYKVLVLKERTDMSEDEYNRLNEKYMKLEFENIVAEGEITVSKDNIAATGLFSEININDKTIDSDSEYGVNLAGVNLYHSLANVELKENEEFTIVAYVDGGLDFSIVRSEEELSKSNTISKTESMSVKVYPNPTRDVLNFQISNSQKEDDMIVKIYDSMGIVVYSEKRRIKNTRNNSINIQSLQSGIYSLIIESENTRKSVKFLKQ